MQIEGFSRPEKTESGTINGIASSLDFKDLEGMGKWLGVGAAADSKALENDGVLPALTLEGMDSTVVKTSIESDKRDEKVHPRPHPDNFRNAGSGKSHQYREAFNGEYGPYASLPPQPGLVDEPASDAPNIECSDRFDEKECAVLEKQVTNIL